jgi:hypothetical protein
VEYFSKMLAQYSIDLLLAPLRDENNCDSDTNRIERLSDQVTRCFCIRKEWAEGLVGVFLLFLLDL